MQCQGLEIEPNVFTGCNGAEDCPICEGTGEVKNCPNCEEPLVFDSQGGAGCSACETTWADQITIGESYEKLDQAILTAEEFAELDLQDGSDKADEEERRRFDDLQFRQTLGTRYRPENQEDDGEIS